MVERFDLLRSDEKFKQDARLSLAEHTRSSLGKKDGVITVEVDDEDPSAPPTWPMPMWKSCASWPRA